MKSERVEEKSLELKDQQQIVTTPASTGVISVALAEAEIKAETIETKAETKTEIKITTEAIKPPAYPTLMSKSSLESTLKQSLLKEPSLLALHCLSISEKNHPVRREQPDGFGLEWVRMTVNGRSVGTAISESPTTPKIDVVKSLLEELTTGFPDAAQQIQWGLKCGNPSSGAMTRLQLLWDTLGQEGIVLGELPSDKITEFTSYPFTQKPLSLMMRLERSCTVYIDSKEATTIKLSLRALPDIKATDTESSIVIMQLVLLEPINQSNFKRINSVLTSLDWSVYSDALYDAKQAASNVWGEMPRLCLATGDGSLYPIKETRKPLKSGLACIQVGDVNIERGELPFALQRKLAELSQAVREDKDLSALNEKLAQLPQEFLLPRDLVAEIKAFTESQRKKEAQNLLAQSFLDVIRLITTWVGIDQATTQLAALPCTKNDQLNWLLDGLVPGSLSMTSNYQKLLDGLAQQGLWFKVITRSAGVQSLVVYGLAACLAPWTKEWIEIRRSSSEHKETIQLEIKTIIYPESLCPLAESAKMPMQRIVLKMPILKSDWDCLLPPLKLAGFKITSLKERPDLIKVEFADLVKKTKQYIDFVLQEYKGTFDELPPTLAQLQADFSKLTSSELIQLVQEVTAYFNLFLKKSDSLPVDKQSKIVKRQQGLLADLLECLQTVEPSSSLDVKGIPRFTKASSLTQFFFKSTFDTLVVHINDLLDAKSTLTDGDLEKLKSFVGEQPFKSVIQSIMKLNERFNKVLKAPAPSTIPRNVVYLQTRLLKSLSEVLEKQAEKRSVASGKSQRQSSAAGTRSSTTSVS